MENDEVMLLDEAAAFLRIHKSTLRQWIAEGKIKAARLSPKYGKFLLLKSECIEAVRKLSEEYSQTVGHYQKPRRYVPQYEPALPHAEAAALLEQELAKIGSKNRKRKTED
ncbi:helix-turn-helix domain-containing protein [Chromobacterium violaceum]|uniref:helix-turn-helix domain-containing protein n=1 Tax=Chromobacterium violaceum TaxID=536 RepID=UPI001C8BA20D|nr:helix-turn-helix domain-containing protein [Chromobacterium violaceum]MBX9267493.1 helix-turn-helix domain-containing protein [Chromobacterium violaceum]